MPWESGASLGGGLACGGEARAEDCCCWGLTADGTVHTLTCGWQQTDKNLGIAVTLQQLDGCDQAV